VAANGVGYINKLSYVNTGLISGWWVYQSDVYLSLAIPPWVGAMALAIVGEEKASSV